MKRENIHVVVCRISVHMARRRWGTICYISKHYCVINYMLSIIKVLVILMKVRKNIGVNLVEINSVYSQKSICYFKDNALTEYREN